MTKKYLEQHLLNNKSWPFEIAKAILNRLKGTLPAKGYVLFETGYGPSGLPHIGTYCEVVRTKMIQYAFELISGGMPTKLTVVSDDMDGLRKIPSNIPNQEMLADYLQRPLTSIPDPFGDKSSYGEYMNSRCKEFLDKFGFEYEFFSATELYKNGVYDEFLLKALEKYDEIMAVMLPTLGEERQQTYSPFLPICPKTGRVLYVPIIKRNTENGTITYVDEETKEEVTIPVTGGNCKLQWKPDFGMRWAALDVDFEMYGKDHLANSEIYTKICKILGNKGPYQFCYEMFLDEEGKKISKSKGNGVTIDQWLTYAPIESLAFYMYQSPKKAKKLFFDVIPKNVDEYLSFSANFHNQSEEEQLQNPVWFVHLGKVPKYELYNISFALLLNLACVCNPTDKSVLWGFISRYAPEATPENAPMLDVLSGYAIKYYNDFIKPNKKFSTPSEVDLQLLKELKTALENIDSSASSEEIQSMFYHVGKNSEYGTNLRGFFQMLYEVMLGQSQGPRLGSFVKLYGMDKTIDLISNILERNK